MKLFCPLLIDGKCLAYPVRPMSCRAHLSTDEKACKRAFLATGNDRINLCAYALELYAHIKEGFRQGLGGLGIESNPLELVSALHQGFQQPALADHWMRGGRIFT